MNALAPPRSRRLRNAGRKVHGWRPVGQVASASPTGRHPWACNPPHSPLPSQQRRAGRVRSFRCRWRYVLLAALAAGLLFAHFGCHGDEDNELFARAAAAVAGQ